MNAVIVSLIHWNLPEAEQKARALVSAGYSVQFDLPPFPELIRRIHKVPPDAILIDLSRLPSQGRDLGVALRQAKATHHIPLLFVGGEQLKVECQKKLGIRAGLKIGLIGAPPEFESRLGELPAGVTLQAGLADPCDLAIWFVHSFAEFEQDLPQVTQASGDIPLWIAWEKKATRPTGQPDTAVTQTIVRKAGLAEGWVDYKICSIDEHWSGLLFQQRKQGESSG